MIARLSATLMLLIAVPAAAQDHSMHDMPAMPVTDAATGTDLPPGNAAPPPAPTDHYASRQFGRDAMTRAHNQMMAENGGQSFAMILFNLAEIDARQGRDGWRWDGEGWFGGDIDRFVVKTEGEGAVGNKVESAEVQALYARAIGPYFNLQAGVRQDIRPKNGRTHLALGFEGLAPWMFDIEGVLFLSSHGDLLGRVEGWYDQRITQRLILQPRIELNLSAQDVPATRTGAGLSSAELGLRLRYEIAREFAPYVGLSYEARTGKTADYVRTKGDDPTSTSLVMGVRFWF